MILGGMVNDDYFHNCCYMIFFQFALVASAGTSSSTGTSGAVFDLFLARNSSGQSEITVSATSTA